MSKIPENPWALHIDDLTRQLGASPDVGLSVQEASTRLSTFGHNRLGEKKQPVLKTIVAPLTEPMMILLLVIAFLFALLAEFTDALALFIIIFIIASVEILQEGKAENSIRSLRELSIPTASLIRQGELMLLQSSDVVPGDITLLSAGNRVPADARLVEAHDLSLDESSLTGESTPAYKDAATTLPQNCSVGDRANMVFAGTLVSSGKGKAIVVATGQGTELGKIASLTASVEEKPTPLQARISELTKSIAIIVVVLTTLIVILGVVRGLVLVESVLVGLSLLIVTVPEDLPILTYVILIASVVTMARKKAIIRKIYSAETLGSTTTICSDKTGTLTQNLMEARMLYAGGRLFPIQGLQEGFSSQDVGEAMRVAVLCNDSTVGRDASRTFAGNSIDAGLLLAAEKLGFKPASVRKGVRLIQETPFDSKRKMMSTAYRLADGATRLFAKGAPEVMVESCAELLLEGRQVPLGVQRRSEILGYVNRMSLDGLRVLGLAYKPLDNGASNFEAVGMVFAGLVGFEDPLRPGAREAVLQCSSSGIRTVMLTGDHPNTAVSVATAVGMDFSRVVRGDEIDGMNEGELKQALAEASIFARVTPEHKFRIVKTLRLEGQVVAVTGDGVNDGPALKEADIGTAMGSGTDVAKEAASMVLADNNFATLVVAIEEGRRLFDNLRKAIRYYLPSKISILTTVFFSTLLGLSTPLVPLQIILLEVVNDIQASTTFATEPAEQDIMRQPPRNTKEPIITTHLMVQILTRASTIFLAAISAYLLYIGSGSIERARTMVLATLLVSLTLLALFSRSERTSLYRLGLRSNKYMLYVLGISLLVIFTIVSFAPLQRIFSTVELSSIDWSIVAVLAFGSTGWIEASKIVRQR